MFSELFRPSNYYFNPYALPVMPVSVFIFFIGVFVFQQNRKSLVNTSFFFLCLSTGLWLFAISLVYLSRSASVAATWYRYVTFLGVVNIMPSLIFFASASLGESRAKRNIAIVNYLIAFIFYGLAVSTDKVVVPYEMRRYFWGFYPIYGFGAALFLLFYLVQFIIGFRKLCLAYKTEKVAIKRTQIGMIAAAILIAFTASVDFLPKFFNVELYPYGYIPMLIYISLVAYAIVRYRAFDIETVIHRTAVWLLSFSFIAIPILVLHRVLFVYIKSSYPVELAFCATSILSLALYLRLIQPKIDHFFQRRHSDLEAIAGSFAEELVHLKGINQLVKHIEDAIRNALYPQRLSISIYDDKAGNENEFLKWLARNNRIAYNLFVDIDPAYASIKEQAKEYCDKTGAIVVIPLVLNENLLGVINLGKKTSLKRYSAAEFNFLATLKNQSAIAISNSLLYENIENQVRQRTKELVEVQKQLVQAEKLATVGTLAGGVAHEINNPLAAILTNVQMLLMDNQKIDRESLEIIEEATKRCRTIVQKLMAYGRKPLEAVDFSEVDLSDVFKSVMSFIGYQLEQENVRIVADLKKDGYVVKGNFNELEQVLTNIILNGRDAISKIKKSGDIRVTLSRNGTWVAIAVEDEGTGISKDVQRKIFDPFFTTKDVGKGLGLGLSICQSIVEKHKGTISIDSELNKGTVVTVRLPAANAADAGKGR